MSNRLIALFFLLFLFASPAFGVRRFTHVEQFTSDNVQFSGSGVFDSFEVVLTPITKNIDFEVLFDTCITGAVLMVQGGKVGDRVSLQIVHPQAGVINEFVTRWYIASDLQKQFELDLSYPANIPTGLKIRVVYMSTADAGVRNVMINYFLHKVVGE